MNLNEYPTSDIYEELSDRPGWSDLIPDSLIEELADDRGLNNLSNHSVEDMAEFINTRSNEFEVVDYAVEEGSLIRLLQKAYDRRLAGYDISAELEKALLMASNRIL